jgi:hypothetical protein
VKDRRWSLARIAATAGFTAIWASRCALAQAPPTPIQDNSFLVEEAYNQERGVVQTIFTYQRAAGSAGYVSSVTQEWPAPGLRHQLSVTLPLQGVRSGTGVAQGLGDVALNYRLQLVGDGGSAAAFSPRLTVLLPTGNADRNLGTGGVGAQVNLPLSLVLSPTIVAHTNLGATYTLSARAPDGSRAPSRGWNAGQSVVWLAHPNLNVLLEAIALRNEILTDGGGAARTTDVWVSPGVRFAVNLPGRLQVVPGVAVPIGVGPSRGKTGLFLYLSAELPVFGGTD